MHVYSDRVRNLLTEKFRTFSGKVRTVAEVRVSQDRIEGIEDQLRLYVDAVTQVLDANRGKLGARRVLHGRVRSDFRPGAARREEFSANRESDVSKWIFRVEGARSRMSCYISSNNERVYVALESTYGTVPAITSAEPDSAGEADGEAGSGADRAAAIKREAGRLSGLPNTIRKTTSFQLNTFMTEWTNQTASAEPGAAVSGGDGRDAGVLHRRDGGVGDGSERRSSSRRRMG